MTMHIPTPAAAPSVFNSRYKKLPKATKPEWERLDREELEDDAIRDATRELRQRTIEEIGGLQRERRKLEAFAARGKLIETASVRDEKAPGGYKQDEVQAPHLLTDIEDEIARKQKTIADCDIRLKKPRPSPSNEARTQWLMNTPSGATFKPKAPKIELRGKTAVERLAIVCEAIEDFRRQAKAAESAPITKAEATAAVFRAIDNEAKPVNFDQCGRVMRGPAGRRAPGAPIWPTHLLSGGREIGDGFGLVVWLLADVLKERAREAIEKAVRPDALTLEERKIVKAELEAKILELEYEAEALFRMARDAGANVERRSGANVAAILQVEVVTD